MLDVWRCAYHLKPEWLKHSDMMDVEPVLLMTVQEEAVR